MRRNTAEDFWSKVKKTAGCWLWTASTVGFGYGQFRINMRMVQAHRFSWELTNGAIPDGLCVLHRCDEPRCVRPDHLFLGTPADNNADRDAKGRRVVSHAPRPSTCGERNHKAKLRADQVVEIRARHAAGAANQKQLAKQYGVTPNLIGLIVRGRIWTHITKGA